MKYQIELKETRSRVFEVDAESASDAILKISEQYSDYKLNLDDSDVTDFSIKEV